MLQDIKDEVLSGEPRYTIRDNQGNILQDNVDIELKTQIIQEGTPVNKALFRNLQGDLYTQDRYNIPIVELTDSSYVFNFNVPLASYEKGKIINIECGRYPLSGENTYTTDIIPKTWTKDNNTTYHSGNGVILTSSTYRSDTNSPIKAFDSSTSTYYSSTSVKGTYGYDWLQLEFPSPTKITKMKTYVRGDIANTLKGCKVQGSNDGNTWDTLYTISSQQTSLTEITLSTTGYYKFYRLYCTIYHSSQEIQLEIYEWQVSEWKESYEYKESFTNPFLNINNLGLKLINGTINYGKKYSLVYNGSSWDIAKDYVIGSYTGDDSSSRTISLGFKPSAVLICSTVEGMYDYNGSSRHYITGHFVIKDIESSIAKITDNGFIVYDSTSSTNNPRLNNSSLTYSYIAFI